jgi:hypothetical protein
VWVRLFREIREREESGLEFCLKECLHLIAGFGKDERSKKIEEIRRWKLRTELTHSLPAERLRREGGSRHRVELEQHFWDPGQTVVISTCVSNKCFLYQ